MSDYFTVPDIERQRTTTGAEGARTVSEDTARLQRIRDRRNAARAPRVTGRDDVAAEAAIECLVVEDIPWLVAGVERTVARLREAEAERDRYRAALEAIREEATYNDAVAGDWLEEAVLAALERTAPKDDERVWVENAEAYLQERTAPKGGEG